MKRQYNKRKICEAIVSTGEYQNKSSRGSEDIWVIAYLERYFNEDKDSIFAFWEKLYQTKYGDIKDEYFARKQFEDYYKKSKMVKFNDDSFNIYLEDIERVQSLDGLLKWEKEFAFSFLVWCDVNRQYNFWEIPYENILRICHYYPRKAFDPNPIIERMISVGILKEVTERYFDSKDGTWEEIGYYEIVTTRDRKEIIGSIVSFEDTSKFFNNFESVKTCSVCGKKFVCNSKTKRDCCFDCWTKKRRMAEHLRYIKRNSAGM